MFVCEDSQYLNKERCDALWWLQLNSAWSESENLSPLDRLSLIWYLQSDLLWSSKSRRTICKYTIVQMMQDCVIDCKEGIMLPIASTLPSENTQTLFSFITDRKVDLNSKCKSKFKEQRKIWSMFVHIHVEIRWSVLYWKWMLTQETMKTQPTYPSPNGKKGSDIAALAFSASEKWPLPVYFQHHFCQVSLCLCECVSPHCISYSVVAPSTQAWNLSPLCQQLLRRNGITGMRLEKIWRMQGEEQRITCGNQWREENRKREILNLWSWINSWCMI